MASPEKPAKLGAWLERIGARQLWGRTHDGEPIGDHSVVFEVWETNDHSKAFIIIVSAQGCDIFTAFPQNRWDRSLEDAEIRLGIFSDQETKKCKLSN